MDEELGRGNRGTKYLSVTLVSPLNQAAAVPVTWTNFVYSVSYCDRSMHIQTESNFCLDAYCY